MTDHEPPLPRRQVDLRTLPSWAQYVIALSTVAVVVALAWQFGGDEPPPTWASDGVVPVLAWVFIASLAATLILKLVRKKNPPK